MRMKLQDTFLCKSWMLLINPLFSPASFTVQLQYVLFFKTVFQLTNVSDSVPAVCLWQQALLVLRLRVLPRQLGALEAPCPAYGGQGATLLYTETAGPFDLKQPGASDTNLTDGCWRGGERREIIYNQQWVISKLGSDETNDSTCMTSGLTLSVLCLLVIAGGVRLQCMAAAVEWIVSILIIENACKADLPFVAMAAKVWI